MLTPEEITRLAADMPEQRPDETSEQYANRYGEWYGNAFAFSFSKHQQTVIPVITVHTKPNQEAA